MRVWGHVKLKGSCQSKWLHMVWGRQSPPSCRSPPVSVSWLCSVALGDAEFWYPLSSFVSPSSDSEQARLVKMVKVQIGLAKTLPSISLITEVVSLS